MVIAYYMTENNMSFQDAYSFVKSKRYVIFPNFGFIKQLQEFETFLKFT